ncbi:hypothetical protein L1049_014044 [Liquidambar formosana]|uniref:RING-type domain-containing protein n=1 Tax=Liquidambar formosana TaxID=63359 RepID=A0AAP0RQA4_LIQFO
MVGRRPRCEMMSGHASSCLSHFGSSVQEIDQSKTGPMLYGFYKPPPLDVKITWSETHDASIQASLHKEWIFFLNKGSAVDISYNVEYPRSSPLSLVIAQSRESLVEWVDDPSYPNTTLSWNIIYGSGKIQQEIFTSSNYYIAVGNLNSEDVEVQLNFTIEAFVYNTTQAYYKCYLSNRLCSLKLFLLRANAAVLTSPGSEQGKPDDNWYLKLSYGARWITYFAGSGVMTVLLLLAFRFCNIFHPVSGDGTGFQAGEVGSERAPLLSPKDDDLSSWGSSYDSISHDEEDLEEWRAAGSIEGKQLKEGENNTRRLCVICFDAPRDCFFLPCGHCAACFTCGTRIAEEAGNCPICRRTMKKPLRGPCAWTIIRARRSRPRSNQCGVDPTDGDPVREREKVENFASHTKTVAGHNLKPTPWHLFEPKTFNDEPRYARASKIIRCSYLKCRYSANIELQRRRLQSQSSQSVLKCPDFFKWIHNDLQPWATTRISLTHLMEAKKFAAFRVVIVGGRLYVDSYYACVQSRAMFTVWGLLQLLRRYPGMVPDVDFMFDCMDKPAINRTEHGSPPPPLFRYCTTADHFDIPFPDWSFWGWPETNLGPWDEELKSIKLGSRARSWANKSPRAYWKGNPDVQSPVRTTLLQCNDSKMWGAEIMRQDWVAEEKGGFEQSKLSKQCNHRYKIYAEGYAWSVSLKYIMSCGSLTLIITPLYQDFFSRGLIPKKNYWPISPTDLCQSIKSAVDWGNENLSKAEVIGKGGQNFMENLSMDRVYDYMYHLLTEYSKLQDFKPIPPSSALEVCVESLLCLADPKQRQFLERSTTFPSPAPPCILQPVDGDLNKSPLTSN